MVITTTYLKARKWPLLIVYLLIAFPFVVIKLLSSSDDAQNNIYIIFILFTHLLVALLWLAVNKLEIGIFEQSLSYKTLLFTKEVNWDEVINVDMQLGFAGQHAHLKWTFFTGKKAINIDPSYFSRTDNRFLAETVIEKCQHATISQSIKNMAKGKFPWYLF